VTVRVGTSGYDYPEWRGAFYPDDLPAGRRLTYYAGVLATVEINYTYYRLPGAATVAGWVAATPPGFRFAVKASKRITHDRRLRDVGEPLAALLDRVRALGERLGPVLFQLPPNFRKDAPLLGELLARLPRAVRVALEFRHPSWLDDEVYALLRAHGAALCVADTETGTTPLLATADFGYLRLRDEGYDDAALDRWAAALAQPAWREAYVFFKHESAGQAPRLARRLQARLAASGSPSP
jgi:uncharacterized protein YecE (DUF72 family)